MGLLMGLLVVLVVGALLLLKITVVVVVGGVALLYLGLFLLLSWLGLGGGWAFVGSLLLGTWLLKQALQSLR